MATYKGQINLINMSDIAEAGSLYTWIMYADDIEGNGISPSSEGKKYIGIAYNKAYSSPSLIPKDYTWTLFQGTSLVRTKIYYAVSKNGVVPPVEIVNLTIGENGLLTFEENGQASLIINNNILGAKIEEVDYYFSIAQNKISSIGAEWSEVIPEVPKGWFLWSKTVYEYSDGTTDTHYSNSYHGEDGPQGKNAQAYSLKVNQSEVLKFVDKDNNTKISPQILTVSVFKEDSAEQEGNKQVTNLNIENFSVQIYNIDTEQWLTVSQEYITLDKLFNFNIDLNAIIKLGNEEENFVANQLLYSECIIKLEYKWREKDELTLKEETFNVVEYVNVRYGMSRDMAQLSVNAADIVASINDAELKFSGSGLQIKNGNFVIVDSEGEELLYSDNGSLALKGKLDAATGTFAGELSAATGTFAGELSAATGTFAGELSAATGSFKGDISAAYGNIGGFTIGTTQLASKSDENGNVNIILDGERGIIEANNILLGTGAVIKDYISVGNTVYIRRADEEDNSFIKVTDTEKKESILTLNANGSINIGYGDNLIEINGAEGYIQSINYKNSGTGWKISNTNSVFNDVTVRGSIRASVLEYGETQAVGGALVVRPSSRIKECEIGSNEQGKYFTILTLESVKGFEEGDYCRIDTDLVKNYFKVLNVDVDNKKIIIDDEVYNVQTYPIVDFGHTIWEDKIPNRAVGISINGSTDDSFLTPQSITVFDFNDDEDFKFIKPRIILGKLPDSLEYGYAKGTYGLYAENVLLKGSLVTQTGEGNQAVYSGISTLYSDNNSPTSSKYSEWFGNNTGEILLWAGANGTSKEQVEESKFFVDKNGNLLAKSGYFKGTIITDATITASAIEAATLRGAGSTPALTIEDASSGIHFISYDANIIKQGYENWEKNEYELEVAYKYKDDCPVLPKTRYRLSLGKWIKKIIVQFRNDNNDIISTMEGTSANFESFYTPEGVSKLQIYFQIEDTNKNLQSIFNSYRIEPELKKYINVFEVTKESIVANVSNFNLNNNFTIGDSGSLVVPNLYVIGENANSKREANGAAIMFDRKRITYTDSFSQDTLEGISTSYLDFQSGIGFSAGGQVNQLELSRDEIKAKASVRLENGIFFGSDVEYRPIEGEQGELIGYDLYIY